VSEIITIFLSQHRTPEEIAACEAVDTNTLRDPQVKKKKTTKGGGMSKFSKRTNKHKQQA
jgi:hypothetical protein